MANVPSVITAAGRGLSTTTRAAAPAASNAIRTVGMSRIEPAVVRAAATKVANMSKPNKDKLARLVGNKKVMLGGAAVGGAALVGYGADELFELLNNSSVDELSDFLSLIDSVDQNAGNDVVQVYNAAVRMSQLDNDFSNSRSEDGFVSQERVTGLGLDREQIEAQQVMMAQYNSVRRVLTYEQLLSLQFLLAHANPEDLATLEDMRANGRF